MKTCTSKEAAQVYGLATLNSGQSMVPLSSLSISSNLGHAGSRQTTRNHMLMLNPSHIPELPLKPTYSLSICPTNNGQSAEKAASSGWTDHCDARRTRPAASCCLPIPANSSKAAKRRGNLTAFRVDVPQSLLSHVHFCRGCLSQPTLSNPFFPRVAGRLV